MIVAGVMSGTSADGIDVAMVEIAASSRAQRSARVRGGPRLWPRARLRLLGHAQIPYPADVRRVVLASMNSPRASVADLARLHFLLGDLYAEAVLSAQQKLRLTAELIGCHGQTIYHQGRPAVYLGRQLAVTWQAGEASRIAARLNVPVVSDFRPADMAVGGKGAPLVPFLDFLLYRDAKIGRIALNIGGIANLTALPRKAALGEVLAFDTGPGNMVIDALSEQLFGEPCDRDGRIAASGRVLEEVVNHFLREGFFRQRPPKTAGREEFGREFAREFLSACNASQPSRVKWTGPAVQKRDVIATATALTARSIRDAIGKWVSAKGEFSELIVSGGGTKNPTLMRALRTELSGSPLQLRSSDEFGIPSAAKEAVAFAVLAFETWNRHPANVPSATGAKRAAVLGK
ncbi:MAG: anhydro-N-acetylmuramic acid kinase, partial [Acidobacteria bacterium]|nr:anhydro-N-acetylmuramic acid kinase [Acidobacteriota bacterium]